MIKWKQRLYAFLLRRILGPYLSSSSNEQLHQSIDVSLQEGRFALKDIDLNVDYLSALISKKRKNQTSHSEEDSRDERHTNSDSPPKIKIRHARIKKLVIHLSLEEHDDADSSNSVAWKAMKLGLASTYDDASSPPLVSLVAHIEIDGIEIDVEADDDINIDELEEGPSFKSSASCPEPSIYSSSPTSSLSPATDTSQTPTQPTKSYISSYVDAALSSLRLSFEMNNLRIRFIGSKSGSDSSNYDTLTTRISQPNKDSMSKSSIKEYWIEFKLAKASYYDVKGSRSETDAVGNEDSASDNNSANRSNKNGNNISPKYKNVVNKVVEFAGISIHTGEKFLPLTSDTTVNDEEDKEKNHGRHQSEGSSKFKAKTNIVGRTEGTGQIFYRVIAYSNTCSSVVAAKERFTSENRKEQKDVAAQQKERAQQDIEVSLNQQWQVSADRVSLGRSMIVLKCFETANTSQRTSNASRSFSDTTQRRAKKTNGMSASTMLGEIKEDVAIDEAKVKEQEKEINAVNGLMQQYFEARHLAETNQVRGGILVPTTAYEDSSHRSSDGDGSGEVIEFDTFFDANDSFSHYKSILEESIMETKLLDDDNGDDFVHTKVKVNLLGGCIKLGFGSILLPPTDGSHNSIAAEEYILLTLDDINLSSSLSCRSSQFEASVSHFLLEDSAVVGTDKSPRAEIGTTLRFQEAESNDELCGSAIVSEAPCISIHFSTDQKEGRNCSVDLEPFDIVYRKETVSRFMNLVEDIQNISSAPGCNGDEACLTSDDRKGSYTNTHVNYDITCPSITVTLAVCSDGTKIDDRLFGRCGYTLQNTPVTQNPTVGITFNNISASVNSKASQEKEESNGDSLCQCDGSYSELCFDHAIIFVTSPCTGRFHIVSGLKRIDVAALSGRVEVEPRLPISIRYSRTAPDVDNNLSAGRKIFPVIPSLSSFKARQDDDDREHEIESMYRSIFASSKVPANTRGNNKFEPRGSDQQKAILSACDKCTAVVEISVPEIVADLTRSEVHALLPILNDMTRSSNDEDDGRKKDVTVSSCNKNRLSRVADTAPPKPERERIGIAINFDQVCLSVHDRFDEKRDSEHSNQNWYSYSIIGKKWKMHSLLDESKLKSIRILAHEANIFEVQNLVQPKSIDEINLFFSVPDRCKRVRDRNIRNSSSLIVPITYRSKLFPPMSSDSPAIAFDAFSPTLDSEDSLSEWCLHLTVYNTTFRYDIDSTWFERIETIFKTQDIQQDSCGKQKSKLGNELETEVDRNREARSSLTRLFLTLADCSLDYTSSNHFSTASRTIVRFGDIRLSSNMVSPSGCIQAYKVSVHDVNIHICNERYTHVVEDSQITGGSIFTTSNRQAKTPDVQTGLFLSPETVLQQMNFITIATLDSLDALITVSTAKTLKDEPRLSSRGDAQKQSEAQTTVTLSAGCLYLYACKDSLACFSDTTGELATKLTALSEEAFAILKEKSSFDSKSKTNERDSLSDVAIDQSTAGEVKSTHSASTNMKDTSHLENMHILSPPLTDLPNTGESTICENVVNQILDPDPPIITAETTEPGDNDDFLLDGYDWTAIENDDSGIDIPPGEEQVARWYSDTESDANRDLTSSVCSHSSWNKQSKVTLHDLHINPLHIPLAPVSDSLRQGDMDAAKFAGTDKDLHVNTRIIVRDFSLRCRFFDGFDWPQTTEAKRVDKIKNRPVFIIESHRESTTKRNKETQCRSESDERSSDSEGDKVERKVRLLTDLLDEDILDTNNGKKKTFSNIPLAEERGKMLMEAAEQKKLSRRTNRFFQISFTGLQARIDSFKESSHHRLASCVNLDIADLFLAETISSPKPVKMLGEWVSDVEHPRDSNNGFIMMKMAAWHPICKVSDDDEIVSDESKAELKLLPLRCHIDQRAVRFISAFFSSEEPEEGDDNHDGTTGSNKKDFVSLQRLKVVPPMRFESFKVKPVKLKVNYCPQKLNVNALRDGALVELINLSPLQDMVITLQRVIMSDHVGFGPVVKDLVGNWIGDVCETQMHKFVTNAAPFRPLTSVGGGFADLFVLPWEAIKKGEPVNRAIRSSANSLAGTVAYEVLNTSSILTKSAATRLSTTLTTHSNYVSQNIPSPTRPSDTPHSITNGDISGHAVKSIAHGINTANYKVIIVPYREYQRTGTIGAMSAIVRGIPIALMAPIGSVTEATSYALLGARNAIRPDIRIEEEAMLSGLQSYDDM